MKTKWSPFVPFAVKTSAAHTPFQVRAKDRPETTVVFNAFGQVLAADSQRPLDWLPEEQADAKAADPVPQDPPPAE